MSKNNRFLPVEIIEQAVAGEQETVKAVIQHFHGYIKYLSFRDRYYNADIQERLEARLMAAILTFRFDLNV